MSYELEPIPQQPQEPIEPDVIWMGSPGVANWDGYYLNDGWLLDYEFGFRDDGYVVWRRKENNH